MLETPNQRNIRSNFSKRWTSRRERFADFFWVQSKLLVFALEAKDKYTAGHSRRVTDIALAIGRELNLSEEELENLQWGSLLHEMSERLL